MSVKVTTQWFEGHRAIRYEYVAGPDLGFVFFLACEVGQPWISEARRKARELADKHDCEVRQVELKNKPWYVDALVPRGSKPPRRETH